MELQAVHFVFLFSLFLSIWQGANAVNCKGCVQLDSISFDKVVSKFKAAVVKFDVAYPYGEKHDQFGKLSLALASNENIFVGDVGIKDYGDKENVDLAERYGIVKEEYPVIMLFLQGQPEPIRYSGEFTNEALQRFVGSKSGLWIGLPGCLEAFDTLAQIFISTSSTADRKAILRQAEEAWDKVTIGQDRKSAEVYVKVMRKVVDKGDEFLRSETERVDSLRKGAKLTGDKKAEMERRLNILQSFQPVEAGKSEL